MHFDYGYTEEGHLGKPYNFGLLKRLVPYMRKHKRPVLIALVLTVLITVFELSIPYLPKLAIDRYILSYWYYFDPASVPESLSNEFGQKYAYLLEDSEGKEPQFIPHSKIKKIDPGDLKTYTEKGLISLERYHRATPDSNGINLRKLKGVKKKTSPYVYVPVKEAGSLSAEKIAGLRRNDLQGVFGIGLFLIFLIGASVFLKYWEYYLLEKSGQHMMHDIRMELFTRIQGQAIPFFDRNPTGRLVTRLTNDIQNLNEMFKSVLITVFKDIFLLFGIVAVLLYLNWRLALVSFVILPFVFGFTMFISRQARDVFREIRKNIASINSFLQERLSGIRVIKLFSQEKRQLKEFEGLNHRNYLAGMKQIKIFAIFMPFMEVFSFVGIGLLIWYGGGKVLQDLITLGSLVAFIGYIQMFFKPIRDISEKYNVMQSAMASMERIFELMDQGEAAQTAEISKGPSSEKGHLIFKDVSFSYEKDTPVLGRVSFEINPGEVVAIVGATGSGKTTIVNLLERFYGLEKGSILLDGIEIQNWPISELRSRIGLVMQDVFIFSGTLGENISLGERDITREKQINISKQVGLDNFIQGLPGGIDHKVREGGKTLSAGQRQLLALGRALAYDPVLLVLDEATSSVDPETERKIQDSIIRVSRRQTTLLIAHRPSTIRMADRILVLNRGQIVEQGTHQELMASGNIYSKLNRIEEINSGHEL